MSLLHRPCLYLLLHICLLGCSAGANVLVSMNETMEVFLGESAQIHCHYRFLNKDPSYFLVQWFLKGPLNSRLRIYYSDRSEEVVDRNTGYWGRINVTNQHQESVLTIHNVQLSDEREFFCQINALAGGNMEANTSLRVFAAPEAPEIRDVTTGISVTNVEPSEIASCETRNGFPRPNITWYRNGTPLVQTPGLVDMKITGSESHGLHTIQNTLFYKVDKKDVDASFTCEVIYRVPGSIRTIMSNSINITVYYPPTMVELWRESPQGLVKEGDTVELRCQGDGNPPPSFIFSKEEVSKNLTGSGDVLILSSVTRRDSGIYQCRPADSGQSTEVKGEMQLAVHYLDPAVVVPEESEVILTGEDLTASCNALSSLKTTTVWYKDGKQVGEGTTLYLKDVTFETTGEYLCVVTVDSLSTLRTTGSVHIIVQGGPQMVGAGQEVQLQEVTGRMVNLSCEAQGYPVPIITWNIIGSQTWHEVMRKSYEDATQSVVSVKVTSDISAQCNVSNDLGAETKAFSIKAIPTTTAPGSSAEGSGVIIVVIILSLLLLAIVISVLYFLHKKGKITFGNSKKNEMNKETTATDGIIVEMTNFTKKEESLLLNPANGDKRAPNDQ